MDQQREKSAQTIVFLNLHICHYKLKSWNNRREQMREINDPQLHKTKQPVNSSQRLHDLCDNIFFCYVSSLICGLHPFWWDYCMCDHFYPTTEVVIFCLCGYCMLCFCCWYLAVFQVNVRICRQRTMEWCMHTQTALWFTFWSPRERNRVRRHVTSTDVHLQDL